MLWETHKVKLEHISPIFGFLFCLDNVQNKHKKIKDKYLNPRYLPSIILIFSTFVLFLHSSLRGCETCDWHAEWRAAYVVETYSMAELD